MFKYIFSITHIPYWVARTQPGGTSQFFHPLQASMVARAAIPPGHGAQEAFKRKWKAAGDLCLQEGIVFVPLALKSLGGWHKAKTRGQ